MSTSQVPSSRFGTLLRQYRRAAGLTQEALAERARLSWRAVQDLERGVNQAPRADTLTLLAAALDLVPAERATLEQAAQRPAARPAVMLPTSTAPFTALPMSPAPDPAVAPVPGAPSPLVGRARELALLDEFLAGTGAAEYGAPLLLLAGEPGIGKTRLLQALAQRAVARGWSVLAGGCHRRDGQQPYSPLVEALARYLHALPPDRLRAVLAGCAWLARLLPELAALESLPAGTVPPEQERRLLFAAVARVLANMTGPAGTLLVLDDLHWAGTDALDLLHALVHASSPVRHDTEPGGAGVLRVVGAYRDTEVRADDPLGHLRADLARAGLLRHHLLGPLAPGDAAELLADLLAEGGAPGRDAQALTARVLERASGTPFFLVSYAQALRAAWDQRPGRDGTARPGQGQASAGPEPDAVPWDVVEGVRQRVALLSEQARRLLGVAAVVGRRVPWALLVAVSAQDEEAVLAGLEVTCQARLLLEDESGAYTFAHDLIREVVEADVGAARRAVLHRRVAEALERAPEGAAAETIAYHYTSAGLVDKALPYLERAGDDAWASRAHGAAEGHYRAAIDHLERLGRALEAALVREKLGDVLSHVGRYAEAIQILDQAAQTFHAAGEWASLARVTVQIGWLHGIGGTPHAGIARLTTLLERLEQSGDSVPRATQYETLGQLLFATGHYGAALAATERAAVLARAEGDDRTCAQTEGSRANLLQMLGRLGDALRVSHEARLLAEAVGDLDMLLVVQRDLAYLHALRGDLAVGQTSIERALVLAEHLADLRQRAFTLALRGWLAFLQGDWPRAHADLDRAIALDQQADRSWHSAYVMLFAARLSLAAGDQAATAAAAQQAYSLADATGDLQALRGAAAIMAELELVAGRPEVAVARLEPLRDRPGLEEYDATMLLPLLAWAYLGLDRLDEAAVTVEQALARARPEEMRLVLLEALRVQALVEVRRERWAEAARSLDEGLALARAMPYPYAEARLLHVAGQCDAARGEPEAARERLAEALALFTRLGARADVTQVEQALASLAQTPSASCSSLPT